MSALQNLLKFKPVVMNPQVSSLVLKRFNNHRAIAQVIPARSKVSAPEMAGLITVMLACWFATPMYVLYNLKYYNGSVERPT